MSRLMCVFKLTARGSRKCSNTIAHTCIPDMIFRRCNQLIQFVFILRTKSYDSFRLPKPKSHLLLYSCSRLISLQRGGAQLLNVEVIDLESKGC